MREQSCSIPRGLKINKNSAEGEVFLVDFPSYRTSRWHRCKSSMRTTGEEPTSATRHDTTRRDCPQRPEPLERNARTILLDSKGAENQQKFSRGRSISC